MEFRFDEAIPVLERTPATVRALLQGLPGPWIAANEGEGTWNPFDVIGHLIHADRTDWIPRAEHLLRHGSALQFPPFDREGMFATSRGRTLDDLLDEFDTVRADSLQRLAGLGITGADLARRGLHPAFGEVTLGQLLATWVAHDLNHVGQIARVMAHQYRDTVGPWKAYLSIMRAR